MGRIIYAYLNDYDLSIVIDIFSKFNILCCDNVKAITNHITKYYFSNNEQTCIKFIPCFYTLNRLQCASFCVENDDLILNSAFTAIKKHIKSTYMLSQDKAYYIGPEIYKDWKNDKYCFSTLLKYSSFYVEEDKIKELFDNIVEKGNIVRNNNVKFGKMHNIDLSAETFVIFTEKSNMLTTILRKNTIRYEFGSECIFVFKRKRNIYEFILDERLYNISDSAIVDLFISIRSANQSGDG